MNQWLAKLSTIVEMLFHTNGHRDVVSLPEEAGEGVAMFRSDVQLSPHFSLYELTATANASLQEENRTLTDDQVAKLIVLAQQGEKIRELVNLPVTVHSGYRCDALNGVIPGSSSTSQHPRCEALDLAVQGQSVDDTFNILLTAAKAGQFTFGQLIIEEAVRSYGVVRWVHCSVIGTLDPSKVGQVMKMNAGADGITHYVMVDKLDF
jgi:hypothetical protein